MKNNLTDAPLHLRDGATATQDGNYLSATATFFANAPGSFANIS